MRIALAVATALAGSIVGAAGAAAPASATPPCAAHVSGYRITGLAMHSGTTCDHAKQVVHHALRLEAHRIGWTCRHDSFDHRYFFFSCWAGNGSGHWLTFDATYA